VESLVTALGGFPIVVKLLESTHGSGVLLARTYSETDTLLATFHRLRERVILQEFIAEAKGRDIRAFVVGNRVIACMERQAPEGEFRSNLHRGGSATPARLSDAEQEIVLQATRCMGLGIAGVDLLRTPRGPLVLEVNASPGLEGIEGITGVDVAAAMADQVVKGIKQYQRRQRKDLPKT